jgi:hypothetical protein
MIFVPLIETDIAVVLPAAMADGVSEIPPGSGLRTGNAKAADVPPPGAGFPRQAPDFPHAKDRSL